MPEKHFASSSASRSPASMRSPVQQKVSETEPPPAPEEGALDKDRVSSPMWAAQQLHFLSKVPLDSLGLQQGDIVCMSMR